MTVLATDGTAAARRGRWAVAAMFLANGFVTGSWAPQIPQLIPRHGIGEAVLGLLLLGLGIGAVGAMTFAGRLIAIYGTRPVLCGFALAIIPALPAVVYAPSLATVAVAIAALGGIMGVMDVSMNAQAVEVERRMARAIMSSSHGFWSLGAAIGSGSGGWLIARLGAEGHAVLAAAVVAVLVAGAMPFLTPGDPPAPRVSGERRALLPRDPLLWLLGVMALFSMVPEGAVIEWSALYLADELGAAVSITGLGVAFLTGAMAVLRFAGDAVRNRFGAVRTLRVSALIGAAGLALAAAAPGPWVAIVAFALAGVGVANMVPILFSAAGNHPGLAAGAGIALVTLMGYSGILVAPASIGWVAEHSGFRLTFAALGVMLVVVAFLARQARAADIGPSNRPSA
jgi:predicted MFS family arabinose efflux permease